MIEATMQVDPAAVGADKSAVAVVMNGKVVGYSQNGQVVITDPEALQAIRNKVGSATRYPPKLPTRRLVPFWPNDKTEDDKPAPAKRIAFPQRNAPCPCGSGKKFKRCCL